MKIEIKKEDYKYILLILVIMGLFSLGKYDFLRYKIPHIDLQDKHGCYFNRGEVWCEAKEKCHFSWIENCSSYDRVPVMIDRGYCTQIGGKIVSSCSADENNLGIIKESADKEVCCLKKPVILGQ